MNTRIATPLIVAGLMLGLIAPPSWNSHLTPHAQAVNSQSALLPVVRSKPQSPGSTTSSPSLPVDGSTVARPEGKIGDQELTSSYACAVLRFFAYEKLSDIDLAEIDMWLGALIVLFDESDQPDLVTKLDTFRTRAHSSGRTFALVSQDQVLSWATSRCGGCGGTNRFPELTVSTCQPNSVSTDEGGTLPQDDPGQDVSTTLKPGSPAPVVPSSDVNSVEAAERSFEDYSKKYLGGRSAKILQACGTTYAIVLRGNYVEFYTLSGSWQQSGSEDFAGSVQTIKEVNVNNDSAIDLLVTWNSNSDGGRYGSLLGSSGSSEGCGWRTLPISLNGSSFYVYGIRQMNVSSGTVTGEDSSGNQIRLVYDASTRTLRQS